MADAMPQGAEDDPFADEILSAPSAASRVYPPCPEGPTKVIVARALVQMKKKPEKYLKKGDDPNKEYPYILLTLQTDKTYAQDGEQKPHNVFYSMKVSDHKKAIMTDFFSSVLGIPVPVNPATKNIALNIKRIKRDGDDEEKRVCPQFENLEFSVVVKTGKSDDGSRTYDNVDSIYATPEQKASNAALFRAGA